MGDLAPTGARNGSRVGVATIIAQRPHRGGNRSSQRRLRDGGYEPEAAVSWSGHRGSPRLAPAAEREPAALKPGMNRIRPSRRLSRSGDRRTVSSPRGPNALRGAGAHCRDGHWDRAPGRHCETEPRCAGRLAIAKAAWRPARRLRGGHPASPTPTGGGRARPDRSPCRR
jgi:hypothetical protein